MHGGDIYRHKVNIDFSVNVNPLGIPIEVKEAMHKAVDYCGAYPDYICEHLINGLADELGIQTSGVVLGNGASELISWIIKIINPQKVVLPVPSFLGYERALGSEFVRYTLKQENNFRLDEGILEQLQSDVDMLILTNPNNPTGALIEDKLMDKILDKAMENDIYVLVDECFMGFCEDGKRHSLVSKLNKYRRLIIIDAFTKLYAVPGIRLGYMLCADMTFADKMRRNMPEWNISTFAQAAGLAVLKMKNRKSYLEDTLAVVGSERKYLMEGLTASGYRVCPSDANFVLFYSKDTGLYEALLTENILIRDCSDYAGLCKGWYRAAVKKHSENVALLGAVNRLKNEYSRENNF